MKIVNIQLKEKTVIKIISNIINNNRNNNIFNKITIMKNNNILVLNLTREVYKNKNILIQGMTKNLILIEVKK